MTPLSQRPKYTTKKEKWYTIDDTPFTVMPVFITNDA